MKILMAAIGVGCLLGACAPEPARHYYTHETKYYTPKKKSPPRTTYRTYPKYGGGSSRTYYGSGGTAESFRATTR